MKTVYPVDKEGVRIGPDEVISDERWEAMRSIKNLRWRLSEEYEDRLKSMTKRELIEAFELPEEDMKLKKSDILTKINNL